MRGLHGLQADRIDRLGNCAAGVLITQGATFNIFIGQKLKNIDSKMSLEQQFRSSLAKENKIRKSIMIEKRKMRKLTSNLDSTSRNTHKLRLQYLNHKKEEEKAAYAQRCKTLLVKNGIFTGGYMDDIIHDAHRMVHNIILQSFVFSTDLCTCNEWTYGSKTCACGKKNIYYDSNSINYEYNGDVNIDMTIPIYSLFCV